MILETFQKEKEKEKKREKQYELLFKQARQEHNSQDPCSIPSS